MKEILNRIEAWFQEHLPEVLDSLNSGANASEIELLENQIQIQLPSAFKELYRWHNGQKSGAYPGLFYGLEFLSLEEVFRNWRSWAELVDEGINQIILGESHVRGKIKEMYANKKWIPFVYDWGGNHLGMDLDPGKHGKVGQIINFGRDEDSKFVFADDLQMFLNWFINQLESENYIISTDDEGRHNFSTKNPEMTHFIDYWKVTVKGHL
ncbi:MAG: SMI1/KNR4 family protein [Desmonostoc vinosum HA7617-LM4]|jgi:cell wall assembly regulator SMI1|nr:SMI1/KNR4 family protein [Desmonostoc vinosum HA7617-LM4]